MSDEEKSQQGKAEGRAEEASVKEGELDEGPSSFGVCSLLRDLKDNIKEREETEEITKRIDN